MRTVGKEVSIFISYSHLDREWFQRLRPLLVFDDHPTRLAHVWHDNELKAGDRWDKEIRNALAGMDVFVCLLSYNFRASAYIRDIEKPAALKREKQKKTIILPLQLIKMDDRDMEDFKPFNPLPEWGKSWYCYRDPAGEYHAASKPIRTGLLDAVERVIKSRPSK
jgi:hypothetical protein